jgi:hypothetical protein
MGAELDSMLLFSGNTARCLIAVKGGIGVKPYFIGMATNIGLRNL